MDALGKASDLLKASGWQAAGIAAGCGLLLWLNTSSITPPFPEWAVLVLWCGTVLAGFLALAALAEQIMKPIRWLWQRAQQTSARKRAEKAFRDYIPHLTEEERQILGYLREKKQKTFTADQDGGYAATLIARRFVVMIGARGQVFDIDKVPFAVPDHVWSVLEAQPDEFPYAPIYSEGRNKVEVQPWRIPWQLR